MSEQYPGGWMTKSPAAPSGPYETSSAPGVWTLSQAAGFVKQGLWPTAGNIAPDPYFDYVTMLLHGDGTNGAQNNTFLDSSTNNFTITRNGNTTQGTFSPFSKEPGKWGNYFANGNNDYLTIATGSGALTFGTGDFTVECWLMKTSATTGIGEFIVNGNDNSNASFYMAIANGKISAGSTNAFPYLSGTTTIALNTWYHCAITRASGTVRIFVNGVLEASVTNTTNYSATPIVSIGSNKPLDANWPFYGNISNLRVVKGTALYTGNFTPSTTPLTAVSGTSLLCCQDNRFIDNSANNFTLTPYGNVSVTPFSPFAPSAAYSTAVNGGSGYFDGSGDYLVTPNTDFSSLGTANFTCELFVYITDPGTGTRCFFQLSTNSAGVNPSTSNSIAINTNRVAGFEAYCGNGSLYVTSAIQKNRWYHLALVRNSGTTTLYVDGVALGTRADSVSYSCGYAAIGAAYDAAIQTMFGYIANVRFLKGTALYTSNFTPPTAPLTAITNTSLLLNFTNAGIYDNAMMNDLETVGNAQISTGVKKYGTGSLDFTGSGDHLLVPSSVFKFGTTTDFTVEFWLYTTTNNRTYDQFIGQWDTPNTFQFSNIGQQVAVQDPGGIVTFGVSMSSIPINTWVHIAYSRAGTSLKLFINGVGYTASRNVDISPNLNYPVGIGKVYPQNNYDMNGYIDDLRITKGYARYTANFTPPTQAFPNK